MSTSTTAGRLDGLKRWQRDLLTIGAYVLVSYVGLALLGVIGGVTLGTIVGTLLNITLFTAVFSLLALALNLHWGYTGLFNIGIAGFMAVGMYTMAVLTAPADPIASPVGGFDLPIWVGIVGGVIAAGAFGAVLSLPALRVRSDYFAIITLGFSEIVRLSLKSDALREIEVGGQTYGTGGGRGIPFKPPTTVVDWLFSLPVIGGLEQPMVSFVEGYDLSSTVVDRAVYAFVVIAAMLAVYALMQRIGHSPFGRVLTAIREDEVVPRSLGKNTQLAKVKAFTLGAALIGLGGILWIGGRGLQVSPQSFRPIVTFYIFIALIIGGQGSNVGSVVGGFTFAAFLWTGPRYLRAIVDANLNTEAPATVYEAVIELGSGDVVPLIGYLTENLAQLRWVFVGVVLIVLMIYRPSGIFGDRKEIAAATNLSRRPEEDNE